MTADNAAPDTQRIDRWLWHARFFKTRTLASKFVNDGNLRITRGETTLRAEKSSFTICAGDVLVFTRNEALRIIEVKDCASRRGPASEAKLLYDDQSPPVPPRPARQTPLFAREKGAGRPTKKDRRALEAIKPG